MFRRLFAIETAAILRRPEGGAPLADAGAYSGVHDFSRFASSPCCYSMWASRTPI